VRPPGVRESFANIEQPKTAQTILRHPKSPRRGLSPVLGVWREPLAVVADASAMGLEWQQAFPSLSRWSSQRTAAEVEQQPAAPRSRTSFLARSAAFQRGARPWSWN